MLSESYLKEALLLRFAVESNESLKINKLEILDWGLKENLFWASYSLGSAQKVTGPSRPLGKVKDAEPSPKQNLDNRNSAKNPLLRSGTQYWTGENTVCITNTRDGLVEVEKLFKALWHRLENFESSTPLEIDNERNFFEIDAFEADIELKCNNMKEAISENKLLLSVEREKLIKEINKKKSQILVRVATLVDEKIN